MRRRLVPLLWALAGFVVGLPLFFPYEAVIPPLLDPKLRAAGIEIEWGTIRYAFPRSLVFRDLVVRGDLGGRTARFEIDRAVVTPSLSTLRGRVAAGIAVEAAGGTIEAQVSLGPPREIEGIGRGLDAARLPVGVLLPWETRGRGGATARLRWDGSLVDAEGLLEWDATGLEIRGVRWLGAAWPPIRADRASGRIEMKERRLFIGVRSEGGNCPLEAEGGVALLDRFAASGVDLGVKIRPAPDVVSSLGPTGEQIGRARTPEGVISLGVTGPLERTQTQFR